MVFHLSKCHLHKNAYMCPFFLIFFFYFQTNVCEHPAKGIVHSKIKFHPFATCHLASADASSKPRNPSGVSQTSSSHIYYNQPIWLGGAVLRPCCPSVWHFNSIARTNKHPFVLRSVSNPRTVTWIPPAKE